MILSRQSNVQRDKNNTLKLKHFLLKFRREIDGVIFNRNKKRKHKSFEAETYS